MFRGGGGLFSLEVRWFDSGGGLGEFCDYVKLRILGRGDFWGGLVRGAKGKKAKAVPVYFADQYHRTTVNMQRSH